MNNSNIPSIFISPAMSTNPSPTPIDVAIYPNRRMCTRLFSYQSNEREKERSPATISYGSQVYFYRCCVKFDSVCFYYAWVGVGGSKFCLVCLCSKCDFINDTVSVFLFYSIWMKCSSLIMFNAGTFRNFIQRRWNDVSSAFASGARFILRMQI